jgi:hypothetical protein
MKKNILLLSIVTLSLILTASDCSESTVPETDTEYFSLQNNPYWNYDIYEVNENGVVSDELLVSKVVRLRNEETLDKKTAFELRVEPSSDNELFTHISVDYDGIFLYMDEVDLNKYVTDPSITAKIPILIPGWIKIMDFNKDEWESFFFELNDQVVEQDTVSGKVQIIGKKQDQKEVTYQGKTYFADVVNLTFDLSAKVQSPSGTIEEGAQSVFTYTFIEGIGIYSVEQKSNELLGITQNTIEILTDNGFLGNP